MADTTPTLDLPIVLRRHVAYLAGEAVDVADEILGRCMFSDATLYLTHRGRMMATEWISLEQ